VLGLEQDSPRGRIYQVLQVDAGKLDIGESFVTHIDRCLGCLACETACPSGVHYGAIVERARAQIEQKYKRPRLQKILRDFFYNEVLTDFSGLAILARWQRMYQRSGLRRLARASGVLKLWGLENIEKLSPEVDEKFFFAEIGKTVPAQGERRGRVAFHAGCIQNVAFSDLNRATVRVLAANGFDVVIFADQACCGALHAHAGYREQSRTLARRNIDALVKAGAVDAIITNAAGCGSHLKDYDDLLHEDAEYAQHALEFAEQVKDVTEFLAAVGMRAKPKAGKMRVTYQDPCHLVHGQKIRKAPRELLQAAGCEIVEMPHSDLCCGSAGTYNVSQNELSMKILDEKMRDVGTVAESVDAIITANVGCMLQLRAGVTQRGWKLPVKHVIEVLDESFCDN